jgi:hypothetical protein
MFGYLRIQPVHFVASRSAIRPLHHFIRPSTPVRVNLHRRPCVPCVDNAGLPISQFLIVDGGVVGRDDYNIEAGDRFPILRNRFLTGPMRVRAWA